MMHEQQARRAVAEIAREIHARGWVANHDGNVSARLGPGRIVCTPTAVSKRRIELDHLLVVDGEGRVLAGRGRPFSELGLHLAVYRTRPDAAAVLHAHPPYATALACAGKPIVAMPIAEAVVSLGATVPVVPFAAPGPDAVRALEPFLVEHDAVLLGSHGTLAWGDDPEQAFLRTELCEHLARILAIACSVGGAQPLPAEALPRLLEARAKAGLGPAGRR